MARPLRIEFAGGLYHVTSRGNRREDIYCDDADRTTWLRLFGEVCARFNWVCHAWCQMTNHYHVVVETVDGHLSDGMRHLNGVYTQRFNRRHDRVGHVFQGRYSAILVERESYLLELARYVVLNPLRANLVGDPIAWPWSSYRAMVGAAPKPPWLDTRSVLEHFGSRRGRATAAYEAFVRAGSGVDPLWTNLRARIYLGSDSFVRTLDQPAMSDKEARAEIPRMQRNPIAMPIEGYRSTHADSRSAMAAAFASGHYTMREIAKSFGVHYSTVSRAVNAPRAGSADESV